MIKILLVSLLSLNTINAIAASVAIYKNKQGQVVHTNVQPDKKFDKYNPIVRETYYRSGSLKNIDSTNSVGVHTSNNSEITNAIKVLQQKGSELESMSKSATKPIKSTKIATTGSIHPTFEVPYDYRLPIKDDITGDWKRFNAPNHLKADFNGDGIIDEAYILPKKGSKLGYGVFVAINKKQAGIQSGRKFQMFKLTADDDMHPQSFAIELAEPSNKVWETACGKGYWDCEIGEPAEVKITKPSIMFCYIESACTMYMWDSDKLSFKEIRFSD